MRFSLQAALLHAALVVMKCCLSNLVYLVGVPSMVPEPDLVDDASEILQEGPSSPCHSLPDNITWSRDWGTGPPGWCSVIRRKHADRMHLRAIFLICHLLRLASCTCSSMPPCFALVDWYEALVIQCNAQFSQCITLSRIEAAAWTVCNARKRCDVLAAIATSRKHGGCATVQRFSNCCTQVVWMLRRHHGSSYAKPSPCSRPMTRVPPEGMRLPLPRTTSHTTRPLSYSSACPVSLRQVTAMWCHLR